VPSRVPSDDLVHFRLTGLPVRPAERPILNQFGWSPSHFSARHVLLCPHIRIIRACVPPPGLLGLPHNWLFGGHAAPARVFPWDRFRLGSAMPVGGHLASVTSAGISARCRPSRLACHLPTVERLGRSTYRPPAPVIWPRDACASWILTFCVCISAFSAARRRSRLSRPWLARAPFGQSNASVDAPGVTTSARLERASVQILHETVEIADLTFG